MTTGLSGAGFQVLSAVENDRAAADAYRMNHPTVKLLFRDVRELDALDLLGVLGQEVGELDLLVGCSPCQGFSRMRTRNGNAAVDDDRNDLVLDFVRLVEGLLPRAVMFENVPGLLHDKRFVEMISRLENKGFRLDYRVRNLADFGVPQRRRRLILIGSRLGPLPVPSGVGPRRTVKCAIGSLPEPSASDDPVHSSVSAHSTLVLERIKRIPKDGGSRIDLGTDDQLACHKTFSGYRDVYGRMAWEKPAPTITRFSINPSKGRYTHPDQDREITLREAALLQTFPLDYQFPLEQYGRFAVASMIGEAVPPDFARQLGEYLAVHLRGNLWQTFFQNQNAQR